MAKVRGRYDLYLKQKGQEKMEEAFALFPPTPTLPIHADTLLSLAKGYPFYAEGGPTISE